jgi:ribosomal protein S25
MTAAHTAMANGDGAGHSLNPREQILAQARAEHDRLLARRDELREELAELERDVKGYEKAMHALDPEYAPPAPVKTGAQPKQVRPAAKRGVGPERLAQIEAAAREIAAENGGDVTQVQVRDRTGLSSAVMTGAFRMLRDNNVLRFARVDKKPGQGGQTKIYKLTRPALRGGAESQLPLDDEDTSAKPAPPRAPKEATRQKVIEAIKAHGQPVTRTVIIERTGIGDIAVRNTLSTLQEEGVVLDAGPASERADGLAMGKMPRTYTLAEGTAR